MKGLQKKSESDVVFLTVKHGSLVRESKGPRAGFEEIEVINPRSGEKIKKYVERFSAVEGMITKIEWYDTEQKYENRYQGWKIHIEAANDSVILDLPFASIPASRFMKLAENIDWSKPVEFRAWKDVKRDATAFWVGQGNESIPQKYTAAHPGDCPAPVQNTRGKWNYDAQMDFLQKQMNEVVIPAVQKANAWRVDGKKEEATNVDQGSLLEEGEPDAESPYSTNGEFSFEALKENLAELSDQKPDVGKDDLLEEYFGTRSWSEVQKLPVDILQAARKKIVDAIIPF